MIHALVVPVKSLKVVTAHWNKFTSALIRGCKKEMFGISFLLGASAPFIIKLVRKNHGSR